MEAAIGTQVKKVLADQQKAKILSTAIIEQSATSNVIKVRGVLPEGKTLTLTRVRLNMK